MKKEKEMLQVYDGEWIVPKRSGYTQECCDCGLKHIIKFRLRKTHIGNQIQIQFKRL